ncbi:hypothetical protein [Aestuariirhabdus litorea]|uniref:Uncharacterized protein n=1 Tax=Aestuariirhabdus litorea TaxID=2528527 RepID=A0A3P3VRW3_9GAMM|nr:hypothetical protein [Aestuariirhabdus litorea]RRJ84718.1 hypothetical protein D0544_06345 [Aestuariirhabdus litorea]RWW97943.1 hypothetical protein DZC74_06340 [Endozoicomonadaceae bacterium GTF-13]
MIEPAAGKQNYEVYLSAAQIQAGMKEVWSNLRGQMAAIEASLFVSHEYRFHKLNAAGSGNPLSAVEPE